MRGVNGSGRKRKNRREVKESLTNKRDQMKDKGEKEKDVQITYDNALAGHQQREVRLTFQNKM